jgi:uncharacterized protein (DUF2141 family)
MGYHSTEELEMMDASRTLNRFTLHSVFSLTMLAAATGTLAAQTPAAPAPAQSAPAPASPAQTTPAPTAPAQGTSTLTVKIKNIRNAKGKIDVALYGKEQGFPMDPSSAVALKQADIDPQTMTATVVFEKLPQGAYAATVMHDENMVGKMEFDGQGIPLEGYGISNNPDSSSGPPTWDASKFNVNQSDTAIEIAMIYWQ